MMEVTQQEITAAQIEMIMGAFVATFSYAMNSFFWNDNITYDAVVDGYEALAGTNYWKYATWTKYYGGMAIAGSSFIFLLLASLGIATDLSLQVLYYASYLTMVQVVVYLVMALLSANQMVDEQKDTAAAGAEAFNNTLYGEVGGFLGLVAMCEFLMIKNMPAFYYGIDQAMDADALFTDF